MKTNLSNIYKNSKVALSYLTGQKAYKAVQTNGTQGRTAPISIKSQDKMLPPLDRLALSSATYDLERNCGIMAAAININTDHIAVFDFQVKTGNKEFDKFLQEKMKHWSQPGNCDISKRFSLSQMLRLIQKTRLLQGDCLVIKTAGAKLQLIESDRICNPTVVPSKFNINLNDYEHGLKIDPITGQVIQYLICSRVSGTARELQAIVPAQDAILVAYRNRIDAYRGISPLSSAVSNTRDLMQSQAFQLMKIRLTALLGFALTRKSVDALERDTTQGTGTYNIDLSGSKPTFFDLKPGEDVKIIQGATPRTETANFYKDMTLQIFRSIGIPYSFYSEDFSNFYGSRGALMMYDRSCAPKRQALIHMLNQITRWLIANWILEGSVKLPNGMSIDDIKFQWIPPGVTSWKPTEQIQGYLMAIASGLMSISKAAKELGGDYEQNIDMLKQNLQYAKDAGVPLYYNINTLTTDINNSIEQNKIANNTSNTKGTN